MDMLMAMASTASTANMDATAISLTMASMAAMVPTAVTAAMDTTHMAMAHTARATMETLTINRLSNDNRGRF